MGDWIKAYDDTIINLDQAERIFLGIGSSPKERVIAVVFSSGRTAIIAKGTWKDMEERLKAIYTTHLRWK
jgi:hypothetical protein